MTWQGTWSGGTAYALNDAVQFGGASYISIQAGTGNQPDTSPTFWSLLAQVGATGPTGPVSSVFGRIGAVVAAANDYSFSQLAGSLAASQMPALTGDVTSSAGSTSTTLSTSGVAAGTFTKLTVDTKGRATAGATASAGDLSNGTSGSGAIVLATSPTLTGTLTAPTVTATTYQVAGVPRIFAVAADFTTAANTSLQTITGLTWTLPANTTLNVPFRCWLAYSQATATAAVSFGIQSATIAPTNIFATGAIYRSTTAATYGNLPTLATTTATAIVTGTPTAITTVWKAEIAGYIENPSNASTNVINIMVSTANAARLVTVKRGSFCSVF